MHLAVDAVGVKHSGGAVVLLDFLEAARRRRDFSRITVFTSPPESRRFVLPAAGDLVDSPQAACERSYGRRILWSLRGLAAASRRAGADAVFCMTGVGCGSTNLPHVTFVQQALPFSPEALERLGAGGRLRYRVMRSLMRRSCRRARAVFVQTPSMKSSVARACGLNPDGIEVFRAPARALASDRTNPPELLPMLAAPAHARLLYVGNDMPYKNMDLAIAGMAALRRQVPGATLFVTWPDSHPACRHEGVVGLGYLGDRALARAYELAAALVMPSLVETSALPLHEAMAKGTAILAADRPYAHDACEDAAVYFDPLQTDAFVAGSLSLLADARNRSETGRRGRALAAERSRTDSYDHMAEALERVISDAPRGVRVHSPQVTAS